jgi:hypothetical protein
MVWPLLLRSGVLALRPARLGLAALIVILVTLAARLPELWLKDGGPAQLASEQGESALRALIGAMTKLEGFTLLDALYDLFVGVPAALIDRYPWSTLAVLPLIVPVWAILGGAVSRSAATEFALQRRMSWPKAVAFSLSRWMSLVGVNFGPPAVIAVVVGLMIVLGWAALVLPWAQVLGAVLFGLALLVSFGIVLMLAGYVLAWPMLMPAVVCEGTDAIDGVQRGLAYVAGKPLRLAVYLLVLLAQLAAMTAVAVLLATWTQQLASWACMMLLPDDKAFVLRMYALSGDAPLTRSEPASASLKAAGAVLAFWREVTWLLVTSFVVSFFLSGSTVLYLLMRRLNDGQDVGELWTPEKKRAAADAEDLGGEDDED